MSAQRKLRRSIARVNGQLPTRKSMSRAMVSQAAELVKARTEVQFLQRFLATLAGKNSDALAVSQEEMMGYDPKRYKIDLIGGNVCMFKKPEEEAAAQPQSEEQVSTSPEVKPLPVSVEAPPEPTVAGAIL